MCKSRVVVPTGVTLEGAGADVTEIVGASAPEGDADGLGDDAVRCVYLCPGATVRGFTLSGGRTAFTGSATADASNDNNLGGGVLGRSVALATVEDCIITGCTACRGGGAAKATLRRCRVLGCKGTGFTTKASATLECSHFSTIIDNCDVYAVCYPRVLENCTFGFGNAGNQSLYLIGKEYCRIVNTIFLSSIHISNQDYNPPMSTPATNCIFAVANNGDYADYLGPGSRVVDASALEFTGDGYTPVIGANEVIDSGDASIAFDDGGKDVYGGQRVYNGQIDVGAVEADWRDRYRLDISDKRGFSVEAASPGVFETSSQKVRVPAGSAAEVAWTNGSNSPRTYFLTLVLPEGASATCTNDGIATKYDAAGTHVCKFRAPAHGKGRLSVECESGTIDIIAALAGVGMTLYLQ